MPRPIPWSQEEVDHLTVLHQTHGPNWQVIADKMKTGRGHGACAAKWYQLKKGRKRGGSRVKAVAHKKRASAALGRDDDEDDSEFDELEETGDQVEPLEQEHEGKKHETRARSDSKAKDPPTVAADPPLPVPSAAPKSPLGTDDEAVANFARGNASLGRILELRARGG